MPKKTGKSKKLGTCDNDLNPHPKIKKGEQCSDLCRNWVKTGKKGKKKQVLTSSGGWCAPSSTPLYDFFSGSPEPQDTELNLNLPTFAATRGGISYPPPNFTSENGRGDHMHVSISKLAHVGALVSFVAAVFGNTVFGHSGLELVSAGLALHVGGELLEDVLAD